MRTPTEWIGGSGRSRSSSSPSSWRRSSSHCRCGSKPSCGRTTCQRAALCEASRALRHPPSVRLRPAEIRHLSALRARVLSAARHVVPRSVDSNAGLPEWMRRLRVDPHSAEVRILRRRSGPNDAWLHGCRVPRQRSGLRRGMTHPAPRAHSLDPVLRDRSHGRHSEPGGVHAERHLGAGWKCLRGDTYRHSGKAVPRFRGNVYRDLGRGLQNLGPTRVVARHGIARDFEHADCRIGGGPNGT